MQSIMTKTDSPQDSNPRTLIGPAKRKASVVSDPTHERSYKLRDGLMTIIAHRDVASGREYKTQYNGVKKWKPSEEILTTLREKYENIKNKEILTKRVETEIKLFRAGKSHFSIANPDAVDPLLIIEWDLLGMAERAIELPQGEVAANPVSRRSPVVHNRLSQYYNEAGESHFSIANPDAVDPLLIIEWDLLGMAERAIELPQGEVAANPVSRRSPVVHNRLSQYYNEAGEVRPVFSKALCEDILTRDRTQINARPMARVGTIIQQPHHQTLTLIRYPSRDALFHQVDEFLHVIEGVVDPGTAVFNNRLGYAFDAYPFSTGRPIKADINIVPNSALGSSKI
eukprot:TRINITY_DN3797_c0_g2_i1.p1 TRINITY_DN3797_c0_g2~~TRINITY_DN3797_c0_g2_i1.p1  ORF type:complete len:341 (-),score=45.58 TRINITY_DN3797_c0_g2_i1:127-1149(-)